MKPIFLIFLISFTPFLFGEVVIEPEVINSKPLVIDGLWDSGWTDVKKIYKVKRKGFAKPISIRTMINEGLIYFLFEWEDESLNAQHKPWIWNNDTKKYEVGEKREDRFILRWGMNIENERATKMNDVWYWGSVIPSQGRADDRLEMISKNPMAKAIKRKDQDSNDYFLKSQGDAGQRSWSTEYSKMGFWLDTTRYKPEVSLVDVKITPAKADEIKTSREDLTAVAVWKNGVWTMELVRKLRTGNFDDVEFNWGMEYFFDISQELYDDAYISHNISLMIDDKQPSEATPLKLKMPVKPLNKDANDNKDSSEKGQIDKNEKN